MEADCSCETPVNYYHTALRHISEDSNHLIYCRGKVSSLVIFFIDTAAI
jgi:hypothetical protein